MGAKCHFKVTTEGWEFKLRAVDAKCHFKITEI